MEQEAITPPISPVNLENHVLSMQLSPTLPQQIEPTATHTLAHGSLFKKPNDEIVGILTESDEKKGTKDDYTSQTFSNSLFYRFIVSIVIASNIILFSVVVMFYEKYHTLEKFMSLITFINLFVGTLHRFELYVRFLFLVATTQVINLILGSYKYYLHMILINIGAVHVGCMFSSTLFLGYYVVLYSVKHYNNMGQIYILINLINLWLLMLCLLVIIILSQQKVRHKKHELFEYTHRFIGWFCVGLLYVFVVLNDKDIILVNKILLLCTTVLIIIPWLSLKKYKINIIKINKNAIKLNFGKNSGSCHCGEFGRVSFNLLEFHSFALALNNKKNNSFSMLISRAGDWTSKIMDNPLNYQNAWMRRITGHGFMYFPKCYNRILFIATGAGIAPVLPWIQLKDKHPDKKMYVLWMTGNPKVNFGSVVDLLLKNNKKHSVIIDTKKFGRPQLSNLINKTYKESKTNCVFCVSNQFVTNQVIKLCRNENIPVYGANWDS